MTMWKFRVGRESGSQKAVSDKMREDWDERARENAEYYVANSTRDWDQREFFRSGEINVANEIMPDMHRICGGERSPLDLSVLEIGCGVGRITKMLARIFGKVTAVDVSTELIYRAHVHLQNLMNAALSLWASPSSSAITHTP